MRTHISHTVCNMCVQLAAHQATQRLGGAGPALVDTADVGTAWRRDIIKAVAEAGKVGSPVAGAV